MELTTEQAKIVYQNMRSTLRELGIEEEAVIRTKLVLIEGQDVDAASVHKPASKMARMTPANVWVPSNLDISDWDSLDLAHFGTAVRETLTEIIPSSMWNVNVPELNIVVVPSNLNASVDGLTMAEVEALLGGTLLYVGQFRQERGKEPRLREAVKSVLDAYQP